MVHFLREQNNRTIIECEVYDSDLSASVDLEEYSLYLLDKVAPSKREEFINDMNYLNEIRRAWWEDDPGVQTPEEFVTEIFINMSKKWDFYYVTD
jgi:hypothetical protein